METPQLKCLLQAYPDFLTRYTPEEHALIEQWQEERRQQEVPDDWWGW